MDKQTLQSLFPLLDERLIEEIIEHGVIREYEAGEEILKAGQSLPFTLLIHKGLVKAFRADEHGNEVFLYYFTPGQACTQSLLTSGINRRSSIKAIAAENTKLLLIPVLLADKWMKKYISWNQFVFASYRERFDELMHIIDVLSFHNMEERLMIYLQEHKKMFRKNMIYLTHAEIADELNTCREVVSRHLKKMEERGYIKLHHHYIELIHLQPVAGK